MTTNLSATIREILQDAGISSEKEALKTQAWLITLAKIDKFQAEASSFRHKYKIEFVQFEEQLRKQHGSEDFDQEEDYLDWKYAEEALKVWTERRDALNVRAA